MKFTEFGFKSALVAAIKTCGYSAPTDIQQQAIPHLVQGRDLLGLAQTGTGKTAAFVLPTLQRLTKKTGKKVQALILTPTRELSEQVHENIQLLGRGTGLQSCTLYGGVSKATQVRKLKQGVDIVVACPGRLLDHLDSKTLDLSSVEVLILDEADQMCDKGFLPDIRRILKKVPHQRQSMVFSATMPKEIRCFVEEILTDPVTIRVNHEKPTATIKHALYQIPQGQKTTLLKHILQHQEMTTTLVFTRTKYKAKNLAQQLQKCGFKTTSLQGNLSQNQRKKAMAGFKAGTFNILVATDIAARGIDVSGISHVINYDMPDTVETYTHRVGRTGRAEQTGDAYTFATSEDLKMVRSVERSLGKSIPRKQVSGLTSLAKISTKTNGKKSNPSSSRTSFDFGISAR
ncbi:MAG: DEAD/DEAH box helicase [Candidatus Electrothrix sp. AS4_5]|nr:DEAD/DEAH box helicase [Candidatus Electrothrix sp. AX1]MCI5183512.1 DEAD/DEAH box helicase [Candidatus Electrothrix gigas]MCI5190032.1 DEAD/DEAH box helicase [Candidatus Electrothrix gigas]